jgi:hypothetical protein
MAKQKAPKLTGDKRLHSLSAERVYRIHHGLNPETGDPLPGTQEHDDDGCACAHCVSHVEGDPDILMAALPGGMAAKTQAVVE